MASSCRASTTRLALILFLSAFIIAVTFTDTATAAGTIGINYGRVANNLPPPLQVVNLLRANNAQTVKIYDTNRQVMSAFTGTRISLTVQLDNKQLLQTANSQLFSDNWILTNIVPFYPSTNITAIAVGNEVTRFAPQLNNFIVPAMRRLFTSLTKFNLEKLIKISSPFPMDVLAESYPPSSGRFRQELVGTVIRPVLDFVDETGSFFMINIYPFITYTNQPENISLEYALGEPNAKGVTDPKTGLHYSSLFDAQIDAVYFAISSTVAVSDNNSNRRQLKSTTTKVHVTETGWPSAGSTRRRRGRRSLLQAIENVATPQNAAKYNGHLINRILTGRGTPWVPQHSLQVYIFSLFNENLKPGPTTERNFGLFYPNGKKVYNVSVTGTKWWCVANPAADNQLSLQRGLDYACGEEGGVDCRPIKKGGKCYQPNSLVAHASWAFSWYYRDKARIGGTCDFGGAGVLTSDKPEFGKCELPAATN